jgi:phosphoribosylformylglycinamidine synthase
MVQTNTVQGPGGEAGVMRIKQGTGAREQGTGAREQGTGNREQGTGNREQGTGKTPQRGLAMALAGNGRWCYLDPKLGAMHAVAEAARKVACTGAVPVAATNCLNFGNPEKPEIMAQFSATIDGIAEACTALGTPITGGNVSFYNETRGEGIYPTPVMGVVGILEDVTKAVPAAFQNIGDAILLIFWEEGASQLAFAKQQNRWLGSSEFAKTMFGELWGIPPAINLEEEATLHQCLRAIAKSGYANSIMDISDGGIAVALAKASCSSGIGFSVGEMWRSKDNAHYLFGENSSCAIVTCSKQNVAAFQSVINLERACMIAPQIGETIQDRAIVKSVSGVFSKGQVLIDVPVSELKAAYSSTLESQLAAEVVTA